MERDDAHADLLIADNGGGHDGASEAGGEAELDVAARVRCRKPGLRLRAVRGRPCRGNACLKRPLDVSGVRGKAGARGTLGDLCRPWVPGDL